MIEEEINNVQDENLKEKLRQSQNLLIQLKEKEAIANTHDQSDVDSLLAQIENS